MNIINLRTGEPFDAAPRMHHREQSLAGASSVSSRSRNLLGLRGAMMGGGKAKWTNPYITDGLIAMWDGEWNAGGGVHDATATDWTDCIQGIVAKINKGEAFTKTSIFDDISAMMDDTYSFTFQTSKISSVLSTDVTVEAVYKLGQPELTDDVPLFGFGSYYNSFMQITGNINANKFLMNSSEFQEYSDVSFRGKIQAFTNTLDRSSLEVNAYYRGSLLKTQTMTAKSTVASDNGWLYGGETVFFGGSGRYWSPSPAADGHAYALRLYNRVLTADEIASNYAVDAERFGIV